MASRLSPGGVYWGDLTHVWCPVPESMQVFCRSSGLQWLGAHENIGASSELKGRLRSLAWGEVGSGYWPARPKQDSPHCVCLGAAPFCLLLSAPSLETP